MNRKLAEAASHANSSPPNVPAFRLGAVAVPLSPWWERTEVEPVNLEPEGSCRSCGFKGQAYCFLPLSLTTGLPVHISANFAVTANRRDLWRRSDDQESSESNLRASWNEALLEKTCPKAYADGLELLAGGLLRQGPSQCKLPFKADNFIPEDLQLPEVWDQCSLWSLWPSTSKGYFSEMPRYVSQELVAREAAVFYAGGEIVDGSFVPAFRSAKSALLCSTHCFNALQPELQSTISRLCLAGRKRLPVQVPHNICPFLEIKGTTWLEPQSLANMLRGFDTKDLPLQEADTLVEYLLSPEGKGSLQLGWD